MEMIRTVAKAWKIPDIRKKIIFTLLMLVVFRVGSQIPVPGIDREILAQTFDSETGLFALFNLFSGGAFSQFTIFALSITPYITASIILQLLTIAIPSLERLAREGVEGRKKIAAYTRYMTVVLAIIQAIGVSIGLFRQALISTDFFSVAVIVLVLTAGTTFLMWLGEQINEHGIGNGISLIIFAGIVSSLPTQMMSAFATWVGTAMGKGTELQGILKFLLYVFAWLLIISFVTFVELSKRKIPVQHSGKSGGQTQSMAKASFLPLKINSAGVIPVIFASSILMAPSVIAAFIDPNAANAG